MKEILQIIIENLVDDKASISINEIEGEKSIVKNICGGFIEVQFIVALFPRF